MKLDYNSPVILTFAIAAALVLIADGLLLGSVMPVFTVGGTMHWGNPVDWLRLFTHVLGHGSVAHLVGNLTLILLLGPIVEEKYGSAALASMILVTALITGALNILLFSTGLLGASGIVFMLILLSSVTNVKKGYVPLTFVLVVVLYLGGEVVQALGPDEVSQAAHLIGGACGAAFGFAFGGRVRQKRS
jgi:membrane associated rhomboid family serine protease